MVFSKYFYSESAVLSKPKVVSACLIVFVLITAFSLLTYPLAIATVATLSMVQISFSLWRIDVRAKETSNRRYVSRHLHHLIDAKIKLKGMGFESPSEARDSLIDEKFDKVYYNTNPKKLIIELTDAIEDTNERFANRVRSSLKDLKAFLPVTHVIEQNTGMNPLKIYENAYNLYLSYRALDEGEIIRTLMSVDLRNKTRRDRAKELIGELMRVEQYMKLQNDVNMIIEKLEIE